MDFIITGLNKSYVDNVVLEDISMELKGGYVHGLIGYNGGGKSTLGKIICGVVEADGGQMYLGDQACTGWGIKKAMESGVFLVEHDAAILPTLSVEENILLGINFIKRNPVFGTFFHRMQFRKKYRELFERYQIECDVHDKASKVNKSLHTIAELVRIQICNPNVVVIDEIDNNIDKKYRRTFDLIIQDMLDKGTSILYISHDLNHVLNIADDVSIIVGNSVLNPKKQPSFEGESIVDMMVRNAKERPPKIDVKPQAVLLEMQSMSNSLIKDFSIELREGEIVGILGLDRQGEASFSNLLFESSGEKYFREEKITVTSPQQAMDAGIIFLDSNMMQNYLFSNSTVWENMMPFHIRSKHLSDELLEEMCQKYLDKLSVKAKPKDKIEHLSTGYQKKVLIVKNILSEGEIYIFDRLTDNIDVVSKVDIYNILNELKRKGKGIILISNDYNEILGMSDVIYVVKDGRTAKRLKNNRYSNRELLDKIYEDAVKEDGKG